MENADTESRPNNQVLNQRQSGILLHPTSLPGPYCSGIFDDNAYRFINFLSSCKFSSWQILPLCPVFEDGSPYNSTSAFAGNLHLVSIQSLYKDFLHRTDIKEPDNFEEKLHYLEKAHHLISQDKNSEAYKNFEVFKENNQFWLKDFAIFSLLKSANNHIHWNYWPEPYRTCNEQACSELADEYNEQYNIECFKQFIFYYQWSKIKSYANSKGIKIIGDIPIFVSDNSSDVWSNQSFFKLDEFSCPKVVAGVPPDYFSATGQRWGNPVYDWSQLETDGYSWWVNRLQHALSLFDIIRIDHFRGFCATWEIPANEETAINGQWVETPGTALFQTLQEKIGTLPIIAEDLGIITDDVETLRDSLGFPGMKILQFAFDSDANNPYLPHNHIQNCVTYTGTHDNDTTVGWFNSLAPQTKDNLNQYLAWPGEQMPWPMIKSTLASVSALAVLPMQDILGLDGIHRMNTPGTTEGNWRWRFQWHQVSHDLSAYLARLNRLYLRTQN